MQAFMKRIKKMRSIDNFFAEFQAFAPYFVQIGVCYNFVPVDELTWNPFH